MNIEVDENDLGSISAAIAKLHRLRTKLIRDVPELRLSNVRWEKRLASLQREHEAITKIFEADLSQIFEKGSGDYYVYAHCSATPLNIKENARHLFAAQLGLTHVPFYIGKGVGDRCEDLQRNEGHRKIRQHLHRQKEEIRVVKIQEHLSEESAFALEGKLIDAFGIKYLCRFGMLVNLDEGLFTKERRALYPKGVAWYLNRMKLQPHGVPKG